MFESCGCILFRVQYFVCWFSYVRLRLFAEHFLVWTLSANIIWIDPMGRRLAITARVHRGRARNWREYDAAVAVESKHYRRRSRNNIIIDGATTVFLSLRTAELVTGITIYYYLDRYQDSRAFVDYLLLSLLQSSSAYQTRVITGARQNGLSAADDITVRAYSVASGTCRAPRRNVSRAPRNVLPLSLCT